MLILKSVSFVSVCFISDLIIYFEAVKLKNIFDVTLVS